MSEQEQLKPCPMCGNNGLIICEENETSDYSFGISVVCDMTKGGCGAQSGFRLSEAEAITAWNARAQQPDNFNEAVYEECAVLHIGFDETDARKTLRNIIAWHTQVALDPRVSSQAAALLAQQPVAEQEHIIPKRLHWILGLDVDVGEILELQQPAQPVAGYKLVPIVPTEEMLKAAINTPYLTVMVDSISARQNLQNAAMYKAMIEAAPDGESKT